jgi:type IV pilus assembly protein PilY1
MLMTDGMWNDAAASLSAAQANVDNTAAPTITGPNSQTYTYSPAWPYRDGTANTLADVAMYYWNHDLHPGLENRVTPTSNDPAFWQHMVNYTISFGASGTLNPATDLPALANGTKSWPAAGADRPENIDDLWHAAVNSRGMYLSARNTDEYSNALKDIIDDIAAVNGSEAGLAVSAKTLSTTSTTKKYEAEFSSARWSGDIKAINLASTGLDSGDPPWTAAANFPTYDSRNLFSYNKLATGTKGVAFNWTDLSSTMQTTMLGGSTTITGADLVNYLRGDRTKETGILRVRASMLGDIVNSTPILVKDQVDGQYAFLPKTSAFSAAQSTYRRFLVAKKQRNAQLFVGANDGFLHAFSDTNGAETFGFMPDSLLGKVKDLASLDYTHEYFVDGPLSEADIYDTSASKWRNLVLGGTGAGAKSLFAINVPVVSYPASATAVPAALTASQSAPGASDILWTISSADTTEPNNFSELGYVLQPPEHGVMMDGSWVMIVGNGYESASKKAQLFIINALTGALIKRLDTGVGSSGTPNGLGGVRVVRNDKKQIVAAYAGDLQGNLWKFDFSSATQSNWAVAFSGNPLFKTTAIEPITAAPTYTLHPNGGVMVLFGTGQLFATGDDSTTAQRALYGVWDMVKLGAASTVATDRITVPETIVAQALSSSALTGTTGLFYGLTVTPVDYQIQLATETRPAYMTKRGWRLPLTVGSGQRLVDNPEMAGGMVLMQTVTPSISQAACTASSLTRYGFLLDPFMMGSTQPTFDTNADGVFTAADNATAAGVLLIGSGPATILRVPLQNKYLIAQARTGVKQNPWLQTQFNSSKRYWRQIISQPN